MISVYTILHIVSERTVYYLSIPLQSLTRLCWDGVCKALCHHNRPIIKWLFILASHVSRVIKTTMARSTHGMGSFFFSPIGHYLFWIPCLIAGVINQSTHFELYFMVKTCWPTHHFLVLYLDFQRLHTFGKPRLHLVTESRFNFMIAAQVFLLDWVSAGRARKWLEAAAVESHPGNLFHMFL